jgi:hypothetical protein
MLTGIYRDVRVTCRDEQQRNELIATYSAVVSDNTRGEPTRKMAQRLVWALMLASRAPARVALAQRQAE